MLYLVLVIKIAWLFTISYFICSFVSELCGSYITTCSLVTLFFKLHYFSYAYYHNCSRRWKIYNLNTQIPGWLTVLAGDHQLWLHQHNPFAYKQYEILHHQLGALFHHQHIWHSIYLETRLHTPPIFQCDHFLFHDWNQ